jgi:hypothetical protein
VLSGQRKQSLRTLCRRRRELAWLAVAALLTLSSCAGSSHRRALTVQALESASSFTPAVTQRAVITDPATLGDLYQALGRRVGLLQIRSVQEWERLRRAAPELGPPPDFRRGAVIGITSDAGLPLDGSWPIWLEAVRVYEGAGLVVARFPGGTFLPDGTTYLEAAQIDGLEGVLLVDVNGTRFYPQ